MASEDNHTKTITSEIEMSPVTPEAVTPTKESDSVTQTKTKESDTQEAEFVDAEDHVKSALQQILFWSFIPILIAYEMLNKAYTTSQDAYANPQKYIVILKQCAKEFPGFAQVQVKRGSAWLSENVGIPAREQFNVYYAQGAEQAQRYYKKCSPELQKYAEKTAAHTVNAAKFASSQATIVSTKISEVVEKDVTPFISEQYAKLSPIVVEYYGKGKEQGLVYFELAKEQTGVYVAKGKEQAAVYYSKGKEQAHAHYEQVKAEYYPKAKAAAIAKYNTTKSYVQKQSLRLQELTAQEWANAKAEWEKSMKEWKMAATKKAE